MALGSHTNCAKDDFPKVIPIVNFNKCEAKGVCTHVCVHDVFKIRQITVEQFSELTFLGKIKTLFSDNRKAFVEKPELCFNCGLCVSACPENAIRLVEVLGG